MIFTIAPLVQEAKSKRRWLVILGVMTGTLLVVLGVFGAAMAWAGSTVAARVTTPWAREAIASTALTVVGLLALAAGMGELGLSRPLLPRVTTLPGPVATGAGGLARRALVIALTFGSTMAIFSPLSAYALVVGWVAAQQSVWLGAVTLMAYGLGLMLPLAVAGTLAVTPGGAATSAAFQERVRLVGGASLAAAGGFLLAIWTLKATWALFLPLG
jgi:cytochrome c biogenesis protein CcdA